MAEITIPLVTVNSTRGPNADDNLSLDSRIINGVISTTVNPITRELDAFVEKRAGLTLRSTTQVGSLTQAIYSSSLGNSTLTIHRNLTSGNQTIVSTNSADTSSVIETLSVAQTPTADDIGLTHISEGIVGSNLTVFFSYGTQHNNNQNFFYSTSIIGGVSQATATNVPARTSGPIIIMDGFVLALDYINSRIYQSSVNSITNAWTAGYMPVNDYGNQVLMMLRSGRNIYVIGQASIEVFENAGNPSGSILKRIRSFAVKIGAQRISFCQAVSILDVIFFVGYQGGVFKIEENGISKVSSSVVDAIMASSAAVLDSASTTTTAGSVHIDAFYYEGRPFLNIVGSTYQNYLTVNAEPTHQYTFWYDILNNMWTEQDFTISSTARVMRFSSGIRTRLTDAAPVSTLGTIYKLDLASPVYQDDSGTMTLTIQLMRTTFGTGKNKIVHQCWLDADEQASGITYLDFSDNDGTSFTTHGQTFDMTNLDMPITGLGSHRGGRIYRLRHYSNTAWRGRALRFKYTVGAS